MNFIVFLKKKPLYLIGFLGIATLLLIFGFNLIDRHGVTTREQIIEVYLSS
jgi:hypothetical protein